MIQGRQRLSFGVFVLEATPQGPELCTRAGQIIAMQPQPLKLLAMLAWRAGEVVSREEMRREIWGTETFVDFERGLNFAIKQIRKVLGDDAKAPRYIQTLPRRGYRFVAHVEQVVSLEAPARSVPAESEPERGHTSRGKRPGRWRWRPAVALLALALIAGAGFLASRSRGPDEMKGPVRLAVLPFDNLSGDPAQEYLRDGMSEELIAQLGRLHPASLAVTARESATQYKNVRADRVRVGRDLRVTFVVEGSIRRTPERLYCTARLVRVSDQIQLWGETYERPTGDVFAMQREIAQQVSRALALELLPMQTTAMARASTLSTAAYEAYLQGRHEMRRGTEEGFRAAEAAFQDAAKLDPGYAPAHAGVAASLVNMADYQLVSAALVCPAASSAAERAHQLDPGLPEAHVWLAETNVLCGGSSRAAWASFRRALELNPSDAEAHERFAWLHFHEGRRMSALAEMAKAAELDPRSPANAAATGYFYLSINRLDEAIEHAAKSLELQAEYPFALYIIGHAHAERRQFESALSALRRAVEASGSRPKYLLAYGLVAADAKQEAEARRMLQRLDQLSHERYVPADYIHALTVRILPQPVHGIGPARY